MYAGSKFVYMKRKPAAGMSGSDDGKDEDRGVSLTSSDEELSDEEMENSMESVFYKKVAAKKPSPASASAAAAPKQAAPPPAAAAGGGFLGSILTTLKGGRKSADGKSAEAVPPASPATPTNLPSPAVAAAGAGSAAPASPASASVAPAADQAPAAASRPPAPPPPPARSRAPHKPKPKKADTNVVSVRLGTLVEKQAIVTGDPAVCSGCTATFSVISKAGDATSWTCEFCSNVNRIALSPNEIPTVDTVDYLLEPAQVGNNAAVASDDSALVVFCIDVSGSMCVTSEVEGKFTMKGGEPKRDVQALNTEGAAQWLPRQKKNVTYVSRLQAVQAAVDAQLESLQRNFPKKRVALICFNNEVVVYGDGSQRPETIAGDRLSNFDELMAAGRRLAAMITRPIRDTRDLLSKQLFALEEGGQTCLGPALTVAVAMAAGAPGSRVLLCTDGRANVGLGSLDALAPRPADRSGIRSEVEQEVERFYQQIADFGKIQGIVISVVSLKGDDCRLEYLGVLPEATGGTVDIVDPLQVHKQFGNILAQALIATHASVSFLLHRGVFVLDEDGQELVMKAGGSQNKVTRDVGNVTSETELTFEYGVRAEMLPENIASLPFQVQISYKKLDGARFMRVISKRFDLTSERSVAEANADIEVLGTNAMQKGARLARRGSYSKARMANFANMMMLGRAAQTEEAQTRLESFVKVANRMDTQLKDEQMKEAEGGGGLNLSDEERMGEDGDSKGAETRKEAKKQARKAKRTDQTSNALYQFSSANKNMF